MSYINEKPVLTLCTPF